MKIGVIQLTSQLEPDKNLEKIRGFYIKPKMKERLRFFYQRFSIRCQMRRRQLLFSGRR
jgi:hypothetical protein